MTPMPKTPKMTAMNLQKLKRMPRVELEKLKVETWLAYMPHQGNELDVVVV